MPLKKKRGAPLTHDYKRNGTITLFVALNVLAGEGGRNMQCHRHQELIRFPNAIERDIPAGKLIHATRVHFPFHPDIKLLAQ